MDKKKFKSILLIAVISILLIAALIQFEWFITVFGLILGLCSPFFIGLGIALVLNRPYKFVRKSTSKALKRSEKSKVTISISLVSVYVFFLAALSLLILFVIPEVSKSIMDIISRAPEYLTSLKSLMDNLEHFVGLNINIFDNVSQYVTGFLQKTQENGIDGVLPKIIELFPEIFNVTKSIAVSITSILIGFAMSIYILATKEFIIRNLKRMTFAFTPEKTAKKICQISLITSDTFSNYISGQLLDASIVGVICFIGLSIFGFPYAGLISVIVATTNVIPIFGPFIGATPSALLLLAIDPKWAFFFIIFILVVQQIDGNIIVPRILGESIGIPPLLVMLAILVGGGLFGVIGLLIGVPTAAVFYQIIKQATEKNLKNKNIEFPIEEDLLQAKEKHTFLHKNK